MGEIIESTRRHYVGDDADKNSIPAVGKSFGDSFHANDKGKQYYWNGTAWKTGLGYEYVPRDVVAIDFTQVDFTINSNWHTGWTGIQGIVPEGAVAVHLELALADGVAGKKGELRGNATTKALNTLNNRTQVAGLTTPYMQGILNMDSNRLVDYFFDTGMDTIVLKVLGWFI